MPTLYTTIDDDFSGSSLDTDLWTDSGYTAGVTVTGGNLNLKTSTTLSQITRVTAIDNKPDGTPLLATLSNTTVEMEAGLIPGAMSGSSSSIVYSLSGGLASEDGQYFAFFELRGEPGHTGYSFDGFVEAPGTGGGYPINLSWISTTEPINVEVDIRVGLDSSGVPYFKYLNAMSAWVTVPISNPNAQGFAFPTNVGVRPILESLNWNVSGAQVTEKVAYAKFSTSEAPVASFTATPTSGNAPLSVNFTDTSVGTFTAWSWDFGNGDTSTDQNPTYEYSDPGKYTVALTATDYRGDGTITKSALIDVLLPIEVDDSIALSPSVGTPTLTLTDPPPPPPPNWTAIGTDDEKTYLYKVFDADNNYIGVWTDVVDDPEFTQQINTAGTTMTVQLGRSADTTTEVRNNRVTQAGDIRITQSSAIRTTVTETTNVVGEGTDLDLNYNVDIYVQYGGFNDRITQDGNIRVTQSGATRVSTYGSPQGTRIFSGFVLDYTSSYGDNTGITATLSSNGFELSNAVIKDVSNNTTVTYSTTAIETVVKSILDTNPGVMSYSASSIDTTGTSITTTFQLNTKLEGITSAYNQAGDGWYWYGNVSENLIYLKNTSVTADHTFLLGYHIKSIDLKRSIETLVNEVYFVGGETVDGDPTTTVYKHYSDATSQSDWRTGLDRITDRRYTITASIDNYANKVIDQNKDPVYTTPLTITSGRYDIETINLGQMVAFGNFGNFIDGLLLQIVSLSYTPTAVTLQLGALQQRQTDIIAGVSDDLDNEQYQGLPIAPS